jgi:hypothetical protein
MPYYAQAYPVEHMPQPDVVRTLLCTMQLGMVYIVRTLLCTMHQFRHGIYTKTLLCTLYYVVEHSIEKDFAMCYAIKHSIYAGLCYALFN